MGVPKVHGLAAPTKDWVPKIKNKKEIGYRKGNVVANGRERQKESVRMSTHTSVHMHLYTFMLLLMHMAVLMGQHDM